MRQLKSFGKSEHPVYKSMRANNVRERMVRAQALGGLEAIRPVLRNARTSVGLDDPLVKQTKAVLYQADCCVRICRDFLVDDSLRSLPLVMSAIAAQLERVQGLGLGPRLWEDPWLEAAREKFSAWSMHRPALVEMIEISKKGSEAFSLALVKLVLGDADIMVHFGRTLAQQLVQLPGAGSALATALARADLGPTTAPDGVYAARAAMIAKARSLLGRLDNKQLDTLLLVEGADSKTGLHSASEQARVTAFCALYQARKSDVLIVSRRLERQLLRQTTPASEIPRLKQAAMRLAEHLEREPRQLCYWRQPAGGFAVRLFPEAGQPSAQQAEQLLGGGVLVEPQDQFHNYHATELAGWSEAGKAAKVFFDFQTVPLTAKRTAEAAARTAAEGSAAYAAVAERAAALGGELGDMKARIRAAKNDEEGAQMHFLAVRRDTNEQMQAALQADDAAEDPASRTGPEREALEAKAKALHEKATAAEEVRDAAAAAWKAAKAFWAKLEPEVLELTATFDAAERDVAAASLERERLWGEAAALEAEAIQVAARYEALLLWNSSSAAAKPFSTPQGSLEASPP